jgi:hypothetical protein
LTVTVQSFVQNFPEYSKAEKALVQKKLDTALRQIDAAAWGDKADTGQMYLAAHLLAAAPEGEQARLKKENRVTTYWIEYERLRKAAVMGLGRVI